MLSKFQKDAELGGKERPGTHPQSSGISLTTTTMNCGSLALQLTTLCHSNPTAGQSGPSTFITALLVPQDTVPRRKGLGVEAGQGQGQIGRISKTFGMVRPKFSFSHYTMALLHVQLHVRSARLGGGAICTPHSSSSGLQVIPTSLWPNIIKSSLNSSSLYGT